MTVAEWTLAVRGLNQQQRGELTVTAWQTAQLAAPHYKRGQQASLFSRFCRALLKPIRKTEADDEKDYRDMTPAERKAAREQMHEKARRRAGERARVKQLDRAYQKQTRDLTVNTEGENG